MYNKVTEHSNNISEFEIGSVVKVHVYGSPKEHDYIGIITQTIPNINEATAESYSQDLKSYMGITGLRDGSCLVYPSANSASELIKQMCEDGQEITLASKPVTIE